MKFDSNATIARIEIDKNGNLILVDPVAHAVCDAINKYNCKLTLKNQFDRVLHFIVRTKQLGYTHEDVVIVVINVDTMIGRPLADILMPGTNWQQMRDLGQIPYARGLAKRNGVESYLAAIDTKTADILRNCAELAVVCN